MQQKPPNSLAPVTLDLTVTESEMDAAANLCSFLAAPRKAPQKAPRIQQTAPQEVARGKQVPKRVYPVKGTRNAAATQRQSLLPKLSKKPAAKPAATAPGTPKKKATARDVATEVMATVGSPSPKRSPVKLANGKAAYVCHSMVDQIGPLYFSAEYLAMENYPKNCATCTKKLLPGRRNPADEKDGITRVNGKREVKICQNALNHRDHVCVHCLCFDCHSLENVNKGRPTRKRAVNSGLRPGPAKRLKNGPTGPPKRNP